MQDRQPGAPGQYKAILSAAEFQKMQAGERFTITMVRDDQPVVEGTPYSKAAVLPDNLAAIICPHVLNPSPADALRALLPRNGKAPMTANLPMGGNRVTGLGEPVADDDAVPLGFANEKFLPKTGGTVNGSVTVKSGLVKNTMDGLGGASLAGTAIGAYVEAFKEGNYAVRRQLITINPEVDGNINTSLLLAETLDGKNWTQVQVIHASNIAMFAAPIAAVTEVSAVSGAIIFRKINNVVYVSVPTGFAEIGKVSIPEGYRPSAQVIIPCIYTDSSYVSYLATAQFSSNGTIVIKDYTGNVVQSGWFNIVTAYHITQS